MRRTVLSLAFVFMFGVVGTLAISPPRVAAEPAPTGGTADTKSKAATNCNPHFLTFPTWYRGLTSGPDCALKSPADAFPKAGDKQLSLYLTKIALNVVEIILQLVAYVSVAYVIYGGFMYLTSGGESAKVVAGRKTLFNALIGLVLSFFSVAIVALIGQNIK